VRVNLSIKLHDLLSLDMRLMFNRTLYVTSFDSLVNCFLRLKSKALKFWQGCAVFSFFYQTCALRLMMSGPEVWLQNWFGSNSNALLPAGVA